MNKNFHLVFSVLFGILAFLNFYLGLTTLTTFSVVNIMVGTYIGFRSYQEYKVYSAKEQ